MNKKKRAEALFKFVVFWILESPTDSETHVPASDRHTTS